MGKNSVYDFAASAFSIQVNLCRFSFDKTRRFSVKLTVGLYPCWWRKEARWLSIPVLQSRSRESKVFTGNRRQSRNRKKGLG